MTFGLTQRFSTFYIRVHRGKSPPHLVDAVEALHHINVFNGYDSLLGLQDITSLRALLAISVISVT